MFQAASMFAFSDAEYGVHVPVFRSKEPQTGPVQEDAMVVAAIAEVAASTEEVAPAGLGEDGCAGGGARAPVSMPSAASMRDAPRVCEEKEQCGGIVFRPDEAGALAKR